MKKVRVVDKELLEHVRNLPCLGCASLDPEAAYAAVFENEVRSHPHHVISRGHGGDDTATNLLPLCFRHHREIHDRGMAAMAERYPVIRAWLITAGHMEEATV